MNEKKHWEDLRNRAIDIAQMQGVSKDLLEDAAQYVCERLWIDGDWYYADFKIIWSKITDFIGKEARENKGQTISPDEIEHMDSYPFLTYIPEIRRIGRMKLASIEEYNFIIVCVAFGISQEDIADFSGIKKDIVAYMIRQCAEQIDKEDLLP